MKTTALIIIQCCTLMLSAQNWKEKILGNKNLVEFGITRTSYPDSRFDDNSNRSHMTYRYFIQANYFVGYTRILKKNYTISVDKTNGFTPGSNTSNTSAIGEILGSRYKLFNIALGKQFQFLKLELTPKISVSYRYSGFQYTVFGYRDPNGILTEPLFASLHYNSVGGAIGLDINYFFAKHIGLGLKTSYNIYPFENAKLSSGNPVDKPDPLLVATHRPLNQMIVLNFKIIARL